MKIRGKRFFQWTMMMVGTALLVPEITIAKETPIKWELVDPSGVVKIIPANPAKRPDTLVDKTILLRWNAKHNADNLLNRLAELFQEKIPSAKIIKLYETNPETNVISRGLSESVEIAQKIAKLKPDLVIGASAD